MSHHGASMGANKDVERVGSDSNVRFHKTNTRKTKPKTDISWLEYQLVAYVTKMNTVYFINFISVLFFEVGLSTDSNYDVNHLKCLGE